MRYTLVVVFAAVCLAVFAPGAVAQDVRPVNVSIGGGFTIPNSDVKIIWVTAITSTSVCR